MKVSVASAGRFHSFHLAHQLQKRGYLQRLYTASYSSTDSSYISPCVVTHNKLVSLCDALYNRLYGRFFVNQSEWYTFKDSLFDTWLGAEYKKHEPSDLVVGWANYLDASASSIKATGAKLVIESGSMHIATLQDILEREYERLKKKARPICAQNRERMLREYEVADAIAVPSTHVKQSFIDQGVAPDKIIMAPYGVDYEFFQASRTMLPHKFTVIFAGMVSILKGIGYLLDAWTKAKLPAEKAQLIIIGAQADDFDGLYNHPSVFYKGAVSQKNLRYWYQNASLFVLPSLQEGLAMVMAESMAAGTPVLCTERTGGRDLLHDNEHGFIVPVADADALAQKIVWAYQYQDELFEMGKHAQRHVSRYTWDQYGQTIIDKYHKLLGLL